MHKFTSICLILAATAACGGDDTGATASGTESASDTDVSTTASTTNSTTASTTASTTVSTTDSTTASTTVSTTDSTDTTADTSATDPTTDTSATETGSECCPASDEPQCFEGSTCCTDGTWACNDDGGNATCDEGIVCEEPACCMPNEAPPCVEGPAMCCSDGSWLCPDEGAACEAGEQCPQPPDNCCDLDQAPDCPPETNITCCEGKLGWQCLGPDELCLPGLVCDAPNCGGEQDSCAQGNVMCCEGLQCCAGQPIQPGEEYCGQQCPKSDRNAKRDFAPINPAQVLEKVVAMPITEWSYKDEDAAVRHIGPMAQDFRAAFGVGKTEKLIFQVDADGVALASIQALHAEIEVLEDENTALKAMLGKLEQRLTALEGAR